MKHTILAVFISSTIATPAIAAKFIPTTAPATTAPVVTSPAATVAPARPVVAAPPTALVPARAAAPTQSHSAFYIGPQLGDLSIGLLMGYQFSKMYAVEIGYDYFAPVRKPNTVFDKSRVNISALALFPIKFSEMGPMAIYAKVGYAYTAEKLTINDPGLGIPAFPATTTVNTTITTGVAGGAGVQVDLSNNTTARLGVDVLSGDRTTYLAAFYKF